MSELTTLPLLATADAPSAARPVLEKAEQGLGFVPNLYAAMANNPALLTAYASGYTAFREHSGFTPVEQEVVFLTISREHGCEYCMAAHSFIAEKMSNVPGEALAALRAGDEIPDPRLAALSLFTAVMVQTRGRPSPGDVRSFLDAGFDETAMLGVIAGIGVKIFSNFSNHLFDTQVDPVFAGHAWEAASD